MVESRYINIPKWIKDEKTILNIQNEVNFWFTWSLSIKSSQLQADFKSQCYIKDHREISTVSTASSFAGVEELQPSIVELPASAFD